MPCCVSVVLIPHAERSCVVIRLKTSTGSEILGHVHCPRAIRSDDGQALGVSQAGRKPLSLALLARYSLHGDRGPAGSGLGVRARQAFKHWILQEPLCHAIDRVQPRNPVFPARSVARWPWRVGRRSESRKKLFLTNPIVRVLDIVVAGDRGRRRETAYSSREGGSRRACFCSNPKISASGFQ